MSFLAARKPAFEPPPKPRLRSSASSSHRREVLRAGIPRCHLSEPLSTTMISLSRIAGERFDDGGDVFREQVAAVPVGDHDAARCIRGRWFGGERCLAGTAKPDPRSASRSHRQCKSRNREDDEQRKSFDERQRMIEERSHSGSISGDDPGPSPPCGPTSPSAKRGPCSSCAASSARCASAGLTPTRFARARWLSVASSRPTHCASSGTWRPVRRERSCAPIRVLIGFSCSSIGDLA